MTAQEFRAMPHERQVFLTLCACVLEAIQQAADTPLGGIPSGHLYAMMPTSIDFDTYVTVIDALKKSCLITETNHLLKPAVKNK